MSIRNRFAAFLVVLNFALLSLLLPAVKSHAQSVPGSATGSGSVFTSTTRLTVFSSIAMHGGTYSGSVYVYGLLNGQSVYISTPVFTPLFGVDAKTSKCVAYGDTSFAGVPAQITWIWNQNLDGTAPCTISWTMKAYNNGDVPGHPSGQILLYYAPAVLSGGQIVVTQPH